MTKSPRLTRRAFVVSATAASFGAARGLPLALKSAPARRVLTLVYDKSLGAMRAVDKVVR